MSSLFNPEERAEKFAYPYDILKIDVLISQCITIGAGDAKEILKSARMLQVH